MLEPVSVGLKFGFLAVLYLFLVWVAWSALRDMRRRPGSGASETEPRPSDATSMYEASAVLNGDEQDVEPKLLVERAPGHESGMAYQIAEGATLGRGDVEIQLEDPFASSRHARITRQGRVLV